MSDLRTLHSLLRHLLDERVDHGTLYTALLLTVQEMDAHHEDGGDLARDGLDLLTGWCAPGLSLRTWKKAAA